MVIAFFTSLIERLPGRWNIEFKLHQTDVLVLIQFKISRKRQRQSKSAKSNHCIWYTSLHSAFKIRIRYLNVICLLVAGRRLSQLELTRRKWFVQPKKITKIKAEKITMIRVAYYGHCEVCCSLRFAQSKLKRQQWKQYNKTVYGAFALNIIKSTTVYELESEQ